MHMEKLFGELLAISEKFRREEYAHKRDVYEQITDVREKYKGIIGIYGLRGVGKTVLLNQIAKEYSHAFYFSVEHLLRRGIRLYDFLKHLHNQGYNEIFIDEIQKYPDWPLETKLFYDDYKPLIWLSGSSAVAIQEKSADLSRRMTLIKVKPFTFREYLRFKRGAELPEVSIDELLDRKNELTKEIAPYLDEFDPYLTSHALPAAYFEKSPDIYERILRRVIEQDMLALKKMDAFYLEAAYRILNFSATSSPDKLSFSKLSSSIGKNINLVMEIVRLFGLSGLFNITLPYASGHKLVRVEPKILFTPSIRSAVCKGVNKQPTKGALREDFFIFHVPEAHYLKTERKRKTPDYIYKDIVFEVGGPSKNRMQAKRGYIVTDSLDFEKNKVPLILFGLLKS